VKTEAPVIVIVLLLALVDPAVRMILKVVLLQEAQLWVQVAPDLIDLLLALEVL
jgi:hypothetical protein